MPDSLQIAGLQPLSTVDWPGKLAAVAFLQGCPWACTYCHNFDILDFHTPGAVPWSAVCDLLDRRRGLLDGLVFSGGEATRQQALLRAAREVHQRGMEVGLHTAGPYPSRLRALVDEGAVDWVGFDVKATPRDYPGLVASPVAAAKVEESLRILIESGVDHEVRLTLWKGGVDYAAEVAQWCIDRGVRNFVVQQLQTEKTPPKWTASAPRWDAAEMLGMLKGFDFNNVAVRGN